LLYLKSGKILITDSRYELESSLSVRDCDIVIVKSSSDIWNLSEIAASRNIKKTGIFSCSVSLGAYNKLAKQGFEIVSFDVDPAFARVLKNDAEIEALKQSVKIQEKSFSESMEKFADNPSETEYAAFLDYLMQLNGSESRAFDTIAAFGENSAMPHAKPGSTRISGNGLLIVDFGAVYNGYCSDQTLTLVFGRVERSLLDMYDCVYTAQRKAIEAVKHGVEINRLYGIAYGYLENKGYAKYIQHGLGHGVGMAVHEPPYLSSLNSGLLEAGAVIAIEPALYIPGAGGVRLEDMVLVAENGFELLTSLSKEKKVIL
ncbi:MAG: M24 family metallopeptidase, partial [Oligoflexia bacterium]|nr:M24 family metallopeptidase [Oligoflexia bacterium]